MKSYIISSYLTRCVLKYLFRIYFVYTKCLGNCENFLYIGAYSNNHSNPNSKQKVGKYLILFKLHRRFIITDLEIEYTVYKFNF